MAHSADTCIEVCAAIAFFGHKLLLATRRPGGSLAGKWEFPGGKCAPGETLQACIARELREELAATVTAAVELASLVHVYPDKTVRLHFMLCRLAAVTAMTPQEGQTFAWFEANDIPDLDLAPADRDFIATVAERGVAPQPPAPTDHDAIRAVATPQPLVPVSRQLLDELGAWFRGERQTGLQPSSHKPDWLRVPYVGAAERLEMRRMLAKACLHTVCESAQCPNRSDCWKRRTATFMALGDTCTRNCRFCAVAHGRPLPPDHDEPAHIAASVHALQLRHVVVTMVTRDDLPDGGADHLAAIVRAIRQTCPDTSVELLVSDFHGRLASVDTILETGLRVFGHNVETVRRLTPQLRSVASFDTSLAVLRHAAAHRRPGTLVKSGLMLGVGETEDEIRQTLRELRDAGVDIVTLGQYLQPTLEHWPVARMVTPEEFDAWRRFAEDELHFRRAVSGPLVRSSYLAEEALHP